MLPWLSVAKSTAQAASSGSSLLAELVMEFAKSQQAWERETALAETEKECIKEIDLRVWKKVG